MVTSNDFLTNIFLDDCKKNGIKAPYQEYLFLEQRKYRFDFAWIKEKIAMEMEGLYASGQRNVVSRHRSAKGYEDDCIKYNLAMLNGWSVYRFTTNQVKSGIAIDFMVKVFHV